MKELLQQLAAYNYWATQQILQVITALPEEKVNMQMSSSFNTMQKTLLHIWDAESIWWQRVKLNERISIPSESFNGTVKELGEKLLMQQRNWKEWVENSTISALEHVVQYYNSKKEHFKQPAWQIVMQVMNHGTYHRGQLINMLRQAGIEKLPQTDFILWSRKK